jgi:uncharacterized protein YlxW (UPF0749 family)
MTTHPRSDASGGPAPPGPRRYVGLLTQVMTNTMDEDYESVAASRRLEPRPVRARRFVGVIVVAGVFGAMLGVSALKTEQSRPADQRERAQLVAQIHRRQSALVAVQGHLSALQAQIADLQQQVSREASQARAVARDVSMFDVAAGTVPVSGPGVVITADNAPGSAGGSGGVILDRDLQAMVNGLWAAGAEAIAINGQRLTSLTAIRYAGRAITVAYRSLTPPYVVTAIGDPESLPARFLETAGGQTWLGLHANFGIVFNTSVRDQVTVPGNPRATLLYATAAGTR